MMQLPIDITSVKGFLAPEEGQALYTYCKQAVTLGPALEVGSYCGKSTVYLGQACRELNTTLFALDHHRGSEEHQWGQAYHDPDLYDVTLGVMDSFKAFRHTLQRAGLEQHVVPLVAPSKVVARDWATPLGMVFIDGGHSLEEALTDYQCWAAHVKARGILAIHDIFPNPEAGGQAPYTIWRQGLASGLFEALDMVNTLGILRRKHN